MPYITERRRKIYDALIEELSKKLNNTENHDVLLGDMNYVLFRLACLLCSKNQNKNKRGKRGKRSYARMAVVSSGMSEAQAEFRRRIMAPYENEKIEQNGDVSY